MVLHLIPWNVRVIALFFVSNLSECDAFSVEHPDYPTVPFDSRPGQFVEVTDEVDNGAGKTALVTNNGKGIIESSLDAYLRNKQINDTTFDNEITNEQQIFQSEELKNCETLRKEAEVEPYICFYFMFITLLLGTLTYAAHHHFHLPIPYTVILFIEGIFIGIFRNDFPEVFQESIDMWVNIDPELILYAFLPALLFGDALGFSWHVFKVAFLQCALLAGPGVIVGTALQAPFMKLIVPSWSWPMCLCFGSIVSATDPVAVVALLKDLGVDRMLTMQVAGESLLNDGIAIVIWTPIQLYMVAQHCVEKYTDIQDQQLNCNVDDVNVTPKSLMFLFFQLAICGSLVGKAFGWITVLLLSKNANRTSHHSATIQISLTVCCAYLSFYIGQMVFGVSGVLCCIFSGVFLAQHAWPQFVEKESISSMWHTLEFGGNTLLFVLAGCIFGITSPQTHSMVAWVQLICTYLAMMLIRLVMLFLFFPVLQRIGVGCHHKDIYVMWWGGLRGAVGLSLALYMRKLAADDKIKKEYGEQCVWLVAGCATITLVLNATTCASLIDWLGIRATKLASRERLINFIRFAITKSTVRRYKQLKQSPMYSDGWIDQEFVLSSVSSFRYRDELLSKLFVLIAEDREVLFIRPILRAWFALVHNRNEIETSQPQKLSARGGSLMSVSSQISSDIESQKMFNKTTTSLEDDLRNTQNISSQMLRELRMGKSPGEVLRHSVVSSIDGDTDNGDTRVELEMKLFEKDPPAEITSETGLTRILPVVEEEKIENSSTTNSGSSPNKGSSPKKKKTKSIPNFLSTGQRLREESTFRQRPHFMMISSGLNKPTQITEILSEEMVMERELFLSMLRSQYWSMMEKGSLPEKSEAQQVLLQSIDRAEDSTRWGLSDITEIRKYINPKPPANNIFVYGWKRFLRFLEVIFIETPARGAGFKLYVPCRLHSGRIVDLCTVVAYLDAHLEVSSKLMGGGEQSMLGYVTQARGEVLRESECQTQEIWNIIDRELITTDDVIVVRTKQVISMLLQEEKKLIHKYCASGLIKDVERDEMLAPVQKDTLRLAVSYRDQSSDF